MGFDITISQFDVAACPHCGKPIKGTRLDYIESGGRAWKEFLKNVGYYVPDDKQTENNWYGKDMTLTTEQAEELDDFAKSLMPYNWEYIHKIVEETLRNNDFVVINADW